jgi:hypothetical protein
MSAVFSACGTWRYLLRRELEAGEGVVNFVMLNPSTADAVRDDPTIRRCIGFARRWGCRELLVTNLFALRTPDPRALRRADDPVGPENDRYLRDAAGRVADTAGLLVAAWGTHGALDGRDVAVLALLREVMGRAPAGAARMAHLGLTAGGLPRHPLFVRGDGALGRFG